MKVPGEMDNVVSKVKVPGETEDIQGEGARRNGYISK